MTFPLDHALDALKLVPSLLGLALYHRITQEDVLATRMRRHVLARMIAFPGSTASDVARALDVDYKTITHHARMLERFGFVMKERDGRRVRFYPVHPPRERDAD